MSSPLNLNRGGSGTLRITYDITAQEIAWALACWRVQEIDDSEPLEPLTAVEVARIVRGMYARRGESWQSDDWADDLDKRYEAEVRTWAFEQVLRHWPHAAASIPEWWLPRAARPIEDVAAAVLAAPLAGLAAMRAGAEQAGVVIADEQSD